MKQKKNSHKIEIFHDSHMNHLMIIACLTSRDEVREKFKTNTIE